MFSPINYNREFEITKKIYGEKGAKSVDKMITTKKINLSKMDEKLSLLNSDIEDLYKKYAEKKKIRQKKEKNEQNLVSRINFLIDEERKIRTKIENNPTKKEEKKIKIKSLKILNSPEIITNTGTIRYKTIESNDDKERDNINRFRHIGEKNKLYIKSYDEKDKRNITLSSYNSSIQNNTNENLTSNNDIKQNIRIKNYNNKNSNIPSNSNVTNNVCIIINNTEQNNALQNSSNNYFNGDLSFGKKENNNMNNTSDINISTTEKEKRKIHIEIQNIKLKLASKIKSLDKEKEKESNSENNEENKNINTNTPSLSMNKNSKYKGNKNGIRSLKNILNMKRKYLKNLNKEIDLKRINNNIKKRSVENKKKIMSFNINLNPDIDYDKDAYKKSSKEKIITKRSYSKPDNISNQRNNIKIINNHIDKNKSQISNKISNNKTLSIDSNEVILYDSNINNNNYITQIKTEKNTDKNNLDYKSPSARTTIPISSLTFQQSIENKRKMLGLGLNIKINEENKEENNIKNIYKNKNINKLKIKYNEKRPKKIKINNNEDEISKSEYNNEDINSYDVLSYPSISAVTNPLDNNIVKNYNFRNNFSLMSIFSNKSNKTNIIKKIIKKKNNDNNNDNNDAKIIKIKNIMNNDIIIRKQEKNKNYVNSIRIIKKREKNNINNFKEDNNPINNNINNNININENNPAYNIHFKKENKTEIKEKKPKLYENEITVKKEIAAIRRINMKIEEYKNYKPQIQKISQRRKNRFQEEKNSINENNNIINNYINKIEDNNVKKNNKRSLSNNNKGKKYRFKSYLRLSEIQGKANESSSKKNSMDKNKKLRSNSNKNMNRLNNNIHLFKFS